MVVDAAAAVVAMTVGNSVVSITNAAELAVVSEGVVKSEMADANDSESGGERDICELI